MSAPVSEAATETEIPVENPATGETIATVPVLGSGEVEAIVARAREAQPIWEAAGFDGRAEVLLAAHRWMVANAERVVTTIVGETGRPADETQLAELAYGLSALEFWARTAPGYLADERIESASPFLRGRRLVVRYAALGVVGVIGPWNYPLINSFGDCVPALAAGNSVVLKPSEVTPLTSLLMAEMLTECEIPEGVFQVATGRGETGAALVDEVDMVMFTGSVATGKRVMAQAAETLTPVSLELGGTDPMLVLADAGIERAADARAGRFLEPTVLADVDHSMRCMTEETYGPALPVMRVGDADEALRLANDGPYGLQASVWTRDTEKGESLARRVEAGVCCVNDAQVNYAALELPMGGWKASGLGSRHGPDGIRKYTKRQSLMITPGYAASRDAHMFPYSAQVTETIGQTVSALAASDLFNDAQRQTLAVLCHDVLPSRTPPEGEADPTGFRTRAASHLGVPEGIEVSPLQANAPEEQIEG